MSELGTLRPIEDTELAMMLTWRNEPAVRANMYTTHVISMDEHLAWWQRVSARPDCQYFMYENHGKPQGIVGFTQLDLGHKNSSWAFYAAPDAAKGTGSRMEFLAICHAFGDLGLHKLHCEVLAFNTPVIRLHEKFGFKVEGVLKEHHLRDGTFLDVYRLACFSSDWASHQGVMLAKLTKHT